MKNKVARLQAIREIIIHSRVKSQDEILKKLHELGFDLTQATLSRPETIEDCQSSRQ